MNPRTLVRQRDVTVCSGRAKLEGSLAVPDVTHGLVLFAHGSGSSRFSSRNRFVAQFLNEAGLATLLFDLLTSQEGEIDQYTRHLRFDIALLTERLVGAIDWTRGETELGRLPIGLFGASTGAAAAVAAAAQRPDHVKAVVSRGGRPDLAEQYLQQLHAPTLLIVGGSDAPVIELNRHAAKVIGCEKCLAIVPTATHLFEEPGTLEQVARLAADWFLQHLAPDRTP